jgi:hypothetical protein
MKILANQITVGVHLLDIGHIIVYPEFLANISLHRVEESPVPLTAFRSNALQMCMPFATDKTLCGRGKILLTMLRTSLRCPPSPFMISTHTFVRVFHRRREESCATTAATKMRYRS